MKRTALVLVLLVAWSVQAGAQEVPKQIAEAGIDQRLGEPVPLDLEFRDTEGNLVRFGQLLNDRPMVLVLAYYRCPRLCSLVIQNTIDGLARTSLEAGKDYNLVVLSFDHEETVELAVRNQELAIERYGRGPEAKDGLHFLVGEKKQIKALADAVGFRYVFDPVERIYKHSAGIMILTPDGKVARYLFGLEFSPKDLRLSLLEASEGRISAPVDRVLLMTCLAYDPTTGQYTVAVFKLVRLAAIVTLFGLGVFLWWNLRNEQRRSQNALSKTPNGT